MCRWQPLETNWSPDAAMYPVTTLESIRALLMWPFPTGDGETFSGSLQPQASETWTVDVMKSTHLVHSVPSFLGISCNFCIQNGSRVSEKPQGTAQVFGLVLWSPGQALRWRWQSPCPSHFHHPQPGDAIIVCQLWTWDHRNSERITHVFLHWFSIVWNETLGLKSHLNQRAFEHAKVQIEKKYFTSCDPHHDIYRFSYWQIFWHIFWHMF